MSTSERDPQAQSKARVLVISVYLAPCREVGGKRFTFLSRYLSKWCDDYHVLARVEQDHFTDESAFAGNVHRVRMRPHFPPIPAKNRGIRKVMMRAWVRSLCLVEAGSGFVIPAALKGIRLCRQHNLNVVVVTIPDFSSLIAATIVSKCTGAALIVDYRDPWSNHVTLYPIPFGKRLARYFERLAIRSSSAIVVCTEIMRDRFNAAFGDIAPASVSVIHNAFENFEQSEPIQDGEKRVDMIYAGNFHGRRRLSIIAPVLAEMRAAGELDRQTFRLHLYSQLPPEDRALIDNLELTDLIEVHAPVPYHEIKTIMSSSDILFLPSGDEVAYAIPFKFFDYLSARRPILAVAPKESSVGTLMEQIDCGELAEFGDTRDIRRALRKILAAEHKYSFSGAERFRWENSARKYLSVIEEATQSESVDPGREKYCRN